MLTRKGILQFTSLQRFWSKVKLYGPDDCWTWTGGKLPRGYGLFWLNGKTEQSHRIAYALENGPLEDFLKSLHTCDNPPCCNPNHLFKGTTADNVADKVSKGRQAVGERINLAILQESDVKRIRAAALADKSRHLIASEFGVSKSTVDQILRRATWKHI